MDEQQQTHPSVPGGDDQASPLPDDPEAQGNVESEAESLTGRRLGRFRVGPVIGTGGMSTLYEATDVRLDRRVALKVISPLLAADEEFRARFVDEARNTSAVDHPHVVPLYDHDEVDGALYIAMRYVDGVNLARVINRRPLHPQRTLALLDQVADALDAVHEHGLVHLDLKPANILVAREGAGEHVYLADFGLTRHGSAGHRTSSGDFLGSPSYASPEHLQGQTVDHRTDLYSLGCVLFACLAGRPPYIGSVGEVVDGHLDGRPPAVGRLRAATRPPAPHDQALTVGPACDELLAWALALDPAARPDSARELLSALRDAMGRDATRRPAQPTRVTPPPPRATAPEVQERRRHAEIAALRTRGPVEPTQRGPFDQRATRPTRAGALAVAVALLAVLVVVLVVVVF